MQSRTSNNPDHIIHLLKQLRSYMNKQKSTSPPGRDTVIKTAKKQTHFQHSETTERKNTLVDMRHIELRIDQLVMDVKHLQRKQDHLECQNQVLFQSVRQINADKQNQNKERSQLMLKLDQMLEIQNRQEQNLNHFKQLFQSRRPAFH